MGKDSVVGAIQSPDVFGGCTVDTCSHSRFGLVSELSDKFQSLSDYDKKRVLVDALWVGSMSDVEGLRAALEPIINAV